MRSAALLALVGLGACHKVDDIALAVRELRDARSEALERALRDATEDLTCDTRSSSLGVAAICVEVWVVAGGKTAAQTSCRDTSVTLGSGEAGLTAFLRGFGPLADGIAEANQNYIRILGYDDAHRPSASLVMCGITPSFPEHLDRTSSPPTLPLYLICKPEATKPATSTIVFGDYCGSSGFVALFP